MIKDIIKKDLMALTLEDSGINALAIMEEYKIFQVPIIDDNQKLMGLFDESNIINMDNIHNSLNYIKNDLKQVFLNSTAHIFQSIQIINTYQLSIIPVVGRNNIYLGYINHLDIIKQIGLNYSDNENFSIIVLSLNKKDYVLSEISRLIEQNNGKIMSMWQELKKEKLNIHLLISCVNNEGIINTLERYDYSIEKTFLSDFKPNKLDDRFESFIKYLNT